MARMTALDFVSQLKLAIGGPDPTLISDAIALRWVNQSYLEVCGSYDFAVLGDKITFTTTALQEDYELDEGGQHRVLNFDHLLDTTNQFQLVEISGDLWGTFTQGGTQSGTPTHWYESGTGATGYRQITLWPIPAGSYAMVFHITIRPADLVLTPTPTSLMLPESWDDPVLNLAVARGWKVLGDQEKAGFWRQEGELLASRAKKFTERSSQEPRRFQSSIAGAFGGRL